MRYPVIVLSLTMFAAGCAGTPPLEGDASLTARNEIVCKTETPTGSHLPKRVCRHKSDIENDERTVRMLEERMQRNGPQWENRPGDND